MRIHSRHLLVLIITICVAVRANAADCPGLLTHLPQSLQDLHPIHKRWLDYAQNRYLAYIEKLADILNLKKINSKSVGSDLEVNGHRYRILAYLGFGGEGTVYLVKTSAGLRAAKIFFEGWYLQGHIRAFSKRRNIQTPDVIDVDAARNTLLMSYIEGVPISDLRLHFQKFEIPAGQAQGILERYNSLRNRNSKIQKAGAGNVIYSFKTDNFYIIDPE